MAGVAYDLVAVAGNAAIHGARPPALDGSAHHNHRPVVGGIPVLHRLEDAHHLVVVVAVVYGEHIPAVCRPLVFDAVAVIFGLYHAADELVVNARVVVREQDA